jgi:hypothetical protein
MLVSSPNEVSQVVSVVHNSQHYTVLLIDITGKRVVIFDGLYRPLLDWIDHVISSLKCTRLIAIDDNYAAAPTGEFAEERKGNILSRVSMVIC